MSVLTEILSAGLLPLLIAGILILALIRKIDAYDLFVKGAKGGIGLAVRTLPHMAAMLIAAKVLEAAGGFALLSKLFSPLLRPLGIPAAVLPLVVMRPFSGSGALGLLAGLLAAFGPESYEARMACMYMGSSETIFYVTSLYFGSVGVTKTRYTLPIALLADMAGLVCAGIFAKVLW